MSVAPRTRDSARFFRKDLAKKHRIQHQKKIKKSYYRIDGCLVYASIIRSIPWNENCQIVYKISTHTQLVFWFKLDRVFCFLKKYVVDYILSSNEQRAIKLKMLRTKIHIAISAIGVLLGLSAFICFCIIYANVEAGMWALMSGKWFQNLLILMVIYSPDKWTE